MARSNPRWERTSSSTPLTSLRRCATAASFVTPSPTARWSMRPDPRSEGRRWLAQAENDLAFAGLAAREGFFAQACFNSQQAAEKALEAFLYAAGAEHVFGHSISELTEECARLDDGFTALRPRVSPLDQFYLTARYPNSLP